MTATSQCAGVGVVGEEGEMGVRAPRGSRTSSALPPALSLLLSVFLNNKMRDGFLSQGTW